MKIGFGGGAGAGIARATVEGTTQILAQVNTTGPSSFQKCTQKDKIIQANIPTSYGTVVMNCEGSVDGSLWDVMQAFSASNAVVNNDPFPYVRVNVVSFTGSAVNAFNVPVARKLTDTPITGGSIDAAALLAYLQLGALYVIDSTSFSVGDYILATDFSTSPEWSGLSFPVIDVGTTQSLIWDAGGKITKLENLQDGTIDIFASILYLALGY